MRGTAWRDRKRLQVFYARLAASGMRSCSAHTAWNNIEDRSRSRPQWVYGIKRHMCHIAHAVYMHMLAATPRHRPTERAERSSADSCTGTDPRARLAALTTRTRARAQRKEIHNIVHRKIKQDVQDRLTRVQRGEGEGETRKHISTKGEGEVVGGRYPRSEREM